MELRQRLKCIFLDFVLFLFLFFIHFLFVFSLFIFFSFSLISFSAGASLSTEEEAFLTTFHLDDEIRTWTDFFQLPLTDRSLSIMPSLPFGTIRAWDTFSNEISIDQVRIAFISC